MELEPITRKEKIIAGQDLTPITRMEMFLKNFGGGGGGSVPKPLTYDYMPDGYPKKSVQTTTLMEEQEVAFALVNNGIYGAILTNALEIVGGQTYTVSWDGTEYECVCVDNGKETYIGNKFIFDNIDDTGEPFLYDFGGNAFATLDTSASHTISVKKKVEVITPMAEEFIPATAKNTTVFYISGLQKLKHADGTEVTAQEAYDAFMNTSVLIVKEGTTYEAISMVWYDNNSAQNDPTNVGYVKLSYVTKVGASVVINDAQVGDSSLVPEQQV